MAEITVAVESVIHGALADAIQAIEEKHQIRVTEIQVEWLDLSKVEERKFLVKRIAIRSESGA